MSTHAQPQLVNHYSIPSKLCKAMAIGPPWAFTIITAASPRQDQRQIISPRIAQTTFLRQEQERIINQPVNTWELITVDGHGHGRHKYTRVQRASCMQVSMSTIAPADPSFSSPPFGSVIDTLDWIDKDSLVIQLIVMFWKFRIATLALPYGTTFACTCVSVRPKYVIGGPRDNALRILSTQADSGLTHSGDT
ncbi:hypothetical protein BDN67DRAFT_1002987 [Paxillus ammoniavirescens]|nr:hypothetical protein BDN67DRAFT_1002987 [Paxillus ammoniavirescens]